MRKLGWMAALAMVAAVPVAAQGITIKTKEGKVETHGEAAKAEPGEATGSGQTREHGDEMRKFVDDLGKARAVNFADGDLTQAEIDALEARARERLAKDMEKLAERERENAHETDPGDRAEESLEIKRARYRASMRALERDLLYEVARLRGPGGDAYEGTFDDLEENIKDTFADLHDKVDDGSPESWPKTLETARKFHTEYSGQITKWADKIGVSAEVPNAKEKIVGMKKSLRERIKRLRNLGGDSYADALEAIEDRVIDTYEGLEAKLEDSVPKGWAEILKEADKFMLNYTAELDGWARKIGGDAAEPGAQDKLAALKQDLKERIKDLRRIGGDDYEDSIDEIAEQVDDVFADLNDQIADGSKDTWPKTLELAAKYHKQFCDSIEDWQRKIVGAERPEQPQPKTGPAPDYPEKDIELPKGEQMDVIEGVRVARLMPMPKKQLGLSNGLSVNEIVDADKALPRAGIEVYDIILKVNGAVIDARSDLRGALDKIAKGTEYEILILRDGEEKTLKPKK